MLRVRDLSVAYGQHRALEGASVAVDAGEIVVILGANGAGKSTLLKAISGISEGRVAGEIVMDGIAIAGMAPNRIVEQGIALVPEGRGIFPQLSVQENLTLGAYTAHARDEEAGNLERVYTLFPKLRERRRQVVRTMSGGEQQMVAVGRAMMSHPRILTLDEPSLGLSPLLCRELFQSLRAVRDSGIGILLVEQNAKQSLAIADRGYLLENGRIVHEDSAEALARDPAVQKAYLGAAGRAAPASHGQGAQPRVWPEPAKEPATPRPGRAAPSDIAAAAMRQFAERPVRPAEPPRTVTPPRPAAQAMPPSPPPAAAVNGARRPGADEILGVPVADLVARATRTSAATTSPRQAPGRTGTAPPPAPAPEMPDLASGSDRLKAVLAEIEDAARRAETYRPTRGRKP